jgi:phosphoglycerol geranylgeranyltransferase
MEWESWRHITKLDPDRQITQKQVDEVLNSGTDAVMVSGTQNITAEKVLCLLEMVSGRGIPVVLEPASEEAVVSGFDYLFVPSVINSPDSDWIIGKHAHWVKRYGKNIDWSKVVPEAYIVLNPDSAVGRVSRANCDISVELAAAYAGCADHFFHFPIVYIEYSGMYGNPALVENVRASIDGATLFYGGGIDSAEKAREMSVYSDAIIVGNAVYEKGIDALKSTIIK